MQTFLSIAMELNRTAVCVVVHCKQEIILERNPY
jgi:hypothetical protein